MSAVIEEDKIQVEHQEPTHVLNQEKQFKDAAAEKGQGFSGYEDLSLFQTISKFKVATLICFAVTLSAATDGYQIGIAGNIVANPGFVNQFGNETDSAGVRIIGASVLGTWGAIGSVCQLLGQVGIPFFADRFGRKWAQYLYLTSLAIGVLFENVGRTWQLWLAAKLFGDSEWELCRASCLTLLAEIIIPTYVAEVAPVRIRGALLSCYNFWFAFGQLIATLALQVMHVNDPNNWLTPIFTQPGELHLVAWAATKGNAELAKKCLKRINWGVKDYDVDAQYRLLEMAIDHELEEAAINHKSTKWYSIFSGVDGFRTLCSGWGLLAQMFLGIGIFYSYASYFFSQVGFNDPFKVTCIVSGIGLAANMIATSLADVVGRRMIINVGNTIQATCCLCVGIVAVAPASSAGQSLVIFFCCLWVLGFISSGAVAWGYVGELSSSRLRPYTAGFGAGLSVVNGIWLNYFVSYMLNANQWNWGLRSAFFYAAAGFPMTIIGYFIFPETNRRSPAELDELFERKIKPWRFHKTKTALDLARDAQATGEAPAA
ncbi:hypothetical protein EHS25_005447 [Saitozyma podzolica]|uniref:Major facilitator superfamily (MFS) profile domain-containing protein n=1 Tax=Saitozyma podzolica TaxID=1890683 RepID=A0A427XYD8_9TREE|nr:hypothetical protein EHS25_005447 [Saitozyma podzolica]